MSDLIERLRDADCDGFYDQLREEAADEIERLTADLNESESQTWAQLERVSKHTAHAQEQKAKWIVVSNENKKMSAVVEAAKKLQADMIMRAELVPFDGDHSVQAGATVWWVFCERLAALEDKI
jgi:hypothetical protein